MRIIIASMPLLALTAILSVSAVNHIDRVAIAKTDESALPETVAIWRRMRTAKPQTFLQARPKIKAELQARPKAESKTPWSAIAS